MKYQLHDYEIDSVVLDNNKIIFSFPNGFYVADENGLELKPLRKKLAFIIDKDGFPNESLESYIYIRKITRRNRRKDISFKQFTALFKKGNMVIHRGLAAVTRWVRLKYAAMNLKKLANWSWNNSFFLQILLLFAPKYAKVPVFV